jgi:hypothetical protein
MIPKMLPIPVLSSHTSTDTAFTPQSSSLTELIEMCLAPLCDFETLRSVSHSTCLHCYSRLIFVVGFPSLHRKSIDKFIDLVFLRLPGIH